MRRILLLAHRLEDAVPVRRSDRSLDVEDRPIERYEDVRRLLGKFGRVMREKTSGTFRRISTPAEGIPHVPVGSRDRVLVENPRDHGSTVEVLEERRRDVIRVRDAFLEEIRACDAVVAMVELESDTRGALIEHAFLCKKPILCLRRHGIVASLHPMYLHREGIVSATYRDEKELLRILTRFFQNVPLRHRDTG